MVDVRPKPCPGGVHACTWANTREPMETTRCDCGQFTWAELRQMALGKAEAKDRKDAG